MIKLLEFSSIMMNKYHSSTRIIAWYMRHESDAKEHLLDKNDSDHWEESCENHLVSYIICSIDFRIKI